MTDGSRSERLLCIGTELHQTVKEKPQEWRQIIREARNVYNGKIIYAANRHQEFRDALFWDALATSVYKPTSHSVTIWAPRPPLCVGLGKNI